MKYPRRNKAEEQKFRELMVLCGLQIEVPKRKRASVDNVPPIYSNWKSVIQTRI